ncbi:MAG: clan AA aspartic protease [Acidobacteria bacterium]|nr:clan AA aspartic protease [Acidobacteriota bacterium]
MGEVRAEVKLINAADESLARRGQMSPEDVRTYEASAVVDSGAVCTILPADVVQALGLASIHRRGVEYADGRNESVPVTESLVLVIRGRRTSDEALVLGNEVLIGQTILEKLDLHVDCANRILIPNPAHPDQAVNKVK